MAVFAYGTSGSGKTHTCTGSRDDPGLIPRAVRDLFAAKAERGDDVEIWVSYLEIWRDMCVDLLVDRAKADKVRPSSRLLTPEDPLVLT